jgi:hypothetical protein
MSFTFGRETPRPALMSTYGEMRLDVKNTKRDFAADELGGPPRPALKPELKRLTSVGTWKRSALIKISQRSFGKKPTAIDWLLPPSAMCVPTAARTLTAPDQPRRRA